MPSPNAVKSYVSGGIYHVYNRGVEKRPIFMCPADFERFTIYFQAFLGSQIILNSAGQSYRKLTDEVELLSYCLMDNHVHLQVMQKSDRGLITFMQSLMTGYTMYFNLKYDRIGPLFQGTYKAVLADGDPQVIETSRYIHRNPSQLKMGECLNYPYSSLANYAEGVFPSWLSPEIISSYFYNPSDYLNFCSRELLEI